MKKQFGKKEITKKSENISEWYSNVVLKAEIADYAPVKGTMVIRPYGYALWEKLQEIFNKMMKKHGIQNAYFPLFIPHSLLEKEKDHIKGFSPELAVVTIGGGEQLKDPLVVRPTSETIMYAMYAQWIQSWRDLPVLINQWNNAVRWEKRTYLFLRTTEFLWQEGHTAHEDEKGAMDMVKTSLEWYRKIYEEYYAMPVFLGAKSEREKFAGAKTTYTVEALMPDGKALQVATSHNLGQNFSKSFEIDFTNREGKSDYVWQTSWGMSTRSLGGLFLTHGDDDGLVLPPKLAPVKMVIIPVLGKDNDGGVLEFCKKIKEAVLNSLKGTEFDGEVQIWDQSEKTFGWKANEAELKGFPLATSIGPKEVRGNGAVLVTRLTHKTDSEELRIRQVKLGDVGKNALQMLKDLQNYLYRRAKKFVDDNTNVVSTYDEFKKTMETKRGFIKAFWCEDPECERKIKEETKATTRLLPLNAKKENGSCIYCNKSAVHQWIFAQAY